MNYLKSIKTLKQWEVNKEQAQLEACRIIQKIARMMYDIEYDSTKYLIWEAIITLSDSMKYRR